MTIVRAYHRTQARVADTIQTEGFADREGTYLTGYIWRGVWVTIDRPWDLVIWDPARGEDAALLVIEIPLALFERYEWAEDEPRDTARH